MNDKENRDIIKRLILSGDYIKKWGGDRQHFDRSATIAPAAMALLVSQSFQRQIDQTTPNMLTLKLKISLAERLLEEHTHKVPPIESFSDSLVTLK